MNSTWGPTSSSSKTLPPNIQNFLENLRSRSGRTQMGSELPEFPFGERTKTKEVESKRIEQFHAAREKEWQTVFDAREKALAKRIEEIREQLKKLALQLSQKTASLDRQVIATVNQPLPNPGVYHLSYLDHIKFLLELIQKDVTDANNWMKAYKQRGQKKGYYWQQTAKQGSSFFLSNERSTATSVG